MDFRKINPKELSKPKIYFIPKISFCSVLILFLVHYNSLVLIACHEHTLETEYMNLTVVRSRKN